MKLFVFGSSLTSSYWNDSAPYYRGIYKNLADLGFHITFAQPEAFPWREHRDDGDYSYAEVIDYDSPYEIPALLKRAREADLVIKHSGVGTDDLLLEAQVLQCKSANTQVGFWDIDASSTLAAVEANALHPLRALLRRYDYILTNGGGARLIERYERLGAYTCHPIYHALDPQTHYPVPGDPEHACDLLFIGDRLCNRELQVEEFFLAAAERAPEFSFALGGDGWETYPVPDNVRLLGRVDYSDYNRLDCSARMVLNLDREPGAGAEFSPSRRIFEAAGTGACLITNPSEGIEMFFEPGCEILVARDANEIVDLLRTVDSKLAREIGAAMRLRAMQEHTYTLRALQIPEILRQPAPKVLPWPRPILKQTA